MNIKINKDITQIKETIFMGLPLRETIWGTVTLAIGFGVFYYLRHTYEESSLFPIITAICCLPTGFMCMAKYQGMTGGQIIIELLHSLMLRFTVLEPENHYDQYAQKAIENQQKEELRNDKIFRKEEKTRKRKKNKL